MRKILNFNLFKKSNGLESVTKLLAEGVPIGEIVKMLGLSLYGFYKWKEEQEEFAKAIEDGIAIKYMLIEDRFIRDCLEGEETVIIETLTDKQGNITKKETIKKSSPSASKVIFYLKNKSKGEYKDNPNFKEDIEELNKTPFIREILANSLNINTDIQEFKHSLLDN